MIIIFIFVFIIIQYGRVLGYNLSQDVPLSSPDWPTVERSFFMETNVEAWKPIFGYEGIYDVSNKGRVKSYPKEKILFGYKKMAPERILTLTALNTSGYRHVGLVKDGIRKPATIHRLVAKAFIFNPDNKPEVNHIDGDKLNNNSDNLEWVTRDEHVIHTNKYIAFNRQKGESHCRSKLTEDIVRQIREGYKNGTYKSYAEIGRVFNLNRHYPSRIINGKNWKHIA